MKNKIISFFNKSSSNWVFWVSLALIFKLAFFIFKIIIRSHTIQGIEGFWGETNEDSAGYLAPIENFIKTGSYSPDYRMPGYGILYLPFILLFSKATACNLVIILQLLLSALSVYSISIIAKLIFKSEKYFYVTFFLYSISCYTCSYDVFLLTESFTTSILIFSVYYLIKYYKSQKSYHLFISGLFLTWAIFCRPILCPFLLFFILFPIITTPRKFVKISFAFLLPFIISDSLWIYHNYTNYQSFYPLFNKKYAEVYHTKYNQISPLLNDNAIADDTAICLVCPFINFGQAWGAPYIWDPNNVIWDKENSSKQKIIINIHAIPGYIYTSKFNKDSLIKLTQILDTLQSEKKFPPYIQKEYNNIIYKKVSDYITSLKKEAPFVYYVKAPLIFLRRFMFNSGSIDLFDKPVSSKNILPYSIKILFAFLYYFVILFAFIGVLAMRKKLFNFKSFDFLIMGISFYIILVHPLILRYCQARFLVPAYPFILVCSVVGILHTYDKLLNRKTINKQPPSYPV